MQLFFVTGVVASLTSALVFYVFATVQTARTYNGLVWGCVAVAMVFAGTGWWSRNATVARAMLAAAWSAVALVCMISVGLGEGIHALALGFFSVLICVLTVVTGVRAGATMALFCTAWVVGLTFAESARWLAGAAAVVASPLLMRMATVLLMIGSSFSVGLMVAQVVAGHLRTVRRTQAQLEHLFAASPDCIMLSEVSTGRMSMVNDRFLSLTGLNADEAVLREIADLGLWANRAEELQFEARLRTRGEVQDMAADLLVKGGERRKMQLSANKFTFDGGDYVVTVARDISRNEQMRLEQQAILSSASLGIALTHGGVITRANQACEAMFGAQQGGLIGRSERSVLSSPGDMAAAHAVVYERLGLGQPVDFEAQVTRTDGHTFWCRLRGRAVDPAQPMHGGTVWITEDVTERRQMQQALAAARDAAEAASRAKSAFLANTSHEIRTPLSGLIGLARLALQPKTEQVQRMGYLRQMLDSAEGLAEIMGSILDMAKIESGKLTLEELSFDLHQLLTTMHATYAVVAMSRGLQCTLDISADVPQFVFGDALRTRQIIGNFVTNALKFTDAGQVSIAATKIVMGTSQDCVRIAVSDTGIGVAPATLAQLFQPFTQADDSTTRRFGGTGLGLSICRELATLLGGTVGAESELGRGSTFWTQLPLRVPNTRDIASSSDGDSTAPMSVVSPFAPRMTGTATAPSTAQRARSAELAGVRVLVAEDNEVNMIIVSAMLEDWQVQVVAAANGRAAVEAVAAASAAGAPIDLILMDVQMPLLDGFAATRELRTHYDATALPIIAVTAGALVAERDAAIDCGMNAFLTKPIDEALLHKTMSALLEGALHQRTAPISSGANRR